MITLYQSATYGGFAIENDDGRQLYVGTDWDFPGLASSFGWSVRDVLADIHGTLTTDGRTLCEHDGTDGTIACQSCGTSATTFIDSAGDWLRENIGATADDPGYFTES